MAKSWRQVRIDTSTAKAVEALEWPELDGRSLSSKVTWMLRRMMERYAPDMDRDVTQ